MTAHIKTPRQKQKHKPHLHQNPTQIILKNSEHSTQTHQDEDVYKGLEEEQEDGFMSTYELSLK